MVTPFHQRVQTWIASTNDVNWAYYMGGGWERWAQGGICLSLMQRPNVPWARCEVLAYTNSQRADIVFKDRDDLDHWDIVELKCCKRWEDESESLYTFLSSTRVGEDVQTVVETQLNQDHMGKSHTKWAIGLFALRDVREYFEDDTLDMAAGLARVQYRFPDLRYKDKNGNIVLVPATYVPCERSIFMVYYSL